MSVRRLSLVTVVSFCAFTGGVMFSVPAALAVTPPVVEEESVLDVAGTSATLRATINPEGSETTYRFVYGTSEAYGSSVPVPDGIVGSGSTPVAVVAHPQGLSQGTTYHYRVVALVASSSETVPGSDGTFTTQPAGSEFSLPDGRQWELVSPPNKYGGQIFTLHWEGPIQAAANGSGMVYETNTPTELEPPGYGQQIEALQVRSVRGAQGWSSRDIAQPHNSATEFGAYPEYEIFSGDLSLALADPRGNDRTLLSSEASEPTLYVRHEALCDSPATAGECYLPLLTGKEGYADVPPGTTFGGRYEGYQGEHAVFLGGTSPDLSHVALVSGAALTKTPNPRQEIYEWSAGAPPAQAVKLVSLLPASEGGGPAESTYVAIKVGGEGVGTRTGARHAISDDGSRIFWQITSGQGNKLYLRDTVKEETIRLDVQQPGVSGGEPFAVFQTASSDGSKVYFSDRQRLTAQSGNEAQYGTQDLYECDIVEEAGRLKCDLTDLTPESGGEAAYVQNIIAGASEDASYVYFIANGLYGDAAERGASPGTFIDRDTLPFHTPTSNLYEYHDGEITYIATLSADDESDWERGGANATEAHGIGRQTTRVSPDGRYLAFMSDRSLTGYDNRDARSGKPDQEVYLYDAVSKRLVCTSCNPTGARPVGVDAHEFTGFYVKNPRPNIVDIMDGAASPDDSFAANLPLGEALQSEDEALYQPRALSDGGRLFFNSSDALVPQDVNGQEDVYEYEPVGVGGCASPSVTFGVKSGGCVGLVSAGTSPEESGFMDASENGDDVFFLTTSKLSSQDTDTSFDIYDAHVCSAAVPCVVPPVSSPPCNSGDSCKAAPSPQPPVFGAPASATFTGTGNVTVSSGRVVVPKSLARSQKLARALRACGKEPRRKRGACKRQARRRFAGKSARRTVGATKKARG